MDIEFSYPVLCTAVDLHGAFKSGQVKARKGKITFDRKSVVAASLEENTPFAFGEMLEFASSTYEISNNIKDYAVVPVPIIISDVPNGNGVSFPAKSLAKFSADFGMPHFKTWIGKPCYEEHANSDTTKAKGIIIDAVMNKVRNYPGFFKVMTLCSFDRTKDPIMYEKIVNRKANAYSMGAYIQHYGCSVCGTKNDTKKDLRCTHITNEHATFYKLHDNRLVYREAWYPQGFEVSRVDNPAYATSISDYVSRLEGS